MQMFFVYEGELPVDLYIDRLSKLVNPELIAAFPDRTLAIDHALSDKTKSRVVIERVFNTQNGDDNNLISECEWVGGSSVTPGSPIEGEARIYGVTDVGNILTVYGFFPIGAKLRYQWQRKENNQFVNIAGETVSTYTTQPGDAGYEVSVKVTATNLTGALQAVNSILVTAPYVAPPLNGTIAIEGEVKPGSVLLANIDALGGGGCPSFQWVRWTSPSDFTTITNAILSAYKITDADIGYELSVFVSRLGFTGEVESPKTAAVPPASLPLLTGAVFIDGNIQVGETLTADVSALNGTGVIEYVWGSADNNTDAMVPIPGETGGSYVITADNENRYIGLTVTRAGYNGLVTSPAAGPVLP